MSLRKGEDDMYCYVIFGENKESNTGHDLYECTMELESGDMVIVPVENVLKEAMVQSIFSTIPEGITIESDKIKRVVSKSDKVVGADLVRVYLLAMVDEYKTGKIVKEEFYATMEHFVSSYILNLDDDYELAQIVTEQLPDACLYYIDEPGDAEEKEVGFRKELEEIEITCKGSIWEKDDKKCENL